MNVCIINNLCINVSHLHHCRYWVGVVWLSVAMGDTRRALHTALCLRDMRLFTEEQKWGMCACVCVELTCVRRCMW